MSVADYTGINKSDGEGGSTHTRAATATGVNQDATEYGVRPFARTRPVTLPLPDGRGGADERARMDEAGDGRTSPCVKGATATAIGRGAASRESPAR